MLSKHGSCFLQARCLYESLIYWYIFKSFHLVEVPVPIGLQHLEIQQCSCVWKEGEVPALLARDDEFSAQLQHRPIPMVCACCTSTCFFVTVNSKIGTCFWLPVPAYASCHSILVLIVIIIGTCHASSTSCNQTVNVCSRATDESKATTLPALPHTARIPYFLKTILKHNSK